MTSPVGTAAYVAKARRALAAARLLLDEHDTEGTCNRAYYAMFYAAHVALLGTPGARETYKTHRGIVADFGKLVVQPGSMDARYGRSFNDIQKLRELADYLGDPPALDDAASALAAAEEFVAAILKRATPSSSR